MARALVSVAVALKCFFVWRPGVPRPTNHTFSRNDWFFGLAAFGGKANKHSFREHLLFLLALVPQAPPKHTRPQKHFGTPLMGWTYDWIFD